MPVLIGPGVGSPVGCRLSQPNSVAPRLQVRPPHRVRRFGRQVLDPELDRVHLHAVGELLHQHFGDEAALRVARRAHRALLAGVDEDVLVRAAAVRELVDVRQRESGGRAGAAGAPRFAVERREHAVGGDARLDASGGRRPIARREMLFLAIEHQLDGRLRLLGQPRADQPLRRPAPSLLPKPPPMYCVITRTLA